MHMASAKAVSPIAIPSPTSVMRKERVLSPITLRVLMLRIRMGERAVEKFVKLIRAIKISNRTAIRNI